MATWGAHIRIAEALLETNNTLDSMHFLVGNVGPDCGVPNEDWSAFEPPKTVSHWITKDGIIDAEQFFECYLSTQSNDNLKQSFLLGYYVHLLTDIEWSKMLHHKIRNDIEYKALEQDPKFIWKIKEDWYDLDHLYFRENPDSIFHSIFKHVETFNDYLDYYPKNGIIRQLRYIINFYSTHKRELEREYKYLNEAEMNAFVIETTQIIKKQFYLKAISI